MTPVIVLKPTPRSAAAHFNLGTALVAAGSSGEGIVQFRRALEIKPDYAPALNNLGSVLVASGQFEEAVRWQEKALELAPEPEKADYQSRLDLYRAGRPYVAG